MTRIATMPVEHILGPYAAARILRAYAYASGGMSAYEVPYDEVQEGRRALGQILRVGMRNPAEDLEFLASYLSMNDLDKATDFIYSYDDWVRSDSFAIKDALTDPSISSRIRSELEELLADPEAHISNTSSGCVKAIAEHLDLQPFIASLAQHDPGGLPTWEMVNLRRSDIQHGWLVHATPHADEIEREGFRFGVDDVRKLALTTHLSDFDKSGPGYDFAFTVDDFEHYGLDRGRPKYGRELVVFYAPYLYTYHYGDNEPQAIFWGPDAERIHRVWFNDDETYSIEIEDEDGYEDEIVFDTLDDLVEELESEGGAISNPEEGFDPEFDAPPEYRTVDELTDEEAEYRARHLWWAAYRSLLQTDEVVYKLVQKLAMRTAERADHATGAPFNRYWRSLMDRTHNEPPINPHEELELVAAALSNPRDLDVQRLYRAAQTPQEIGPLTSWAEYEEDAVAYTDDPGFGGPWLLTADVPISRDRVLYLIDAPFDDLAELLDDGRDAAALRADYGQVFTALETARGATQKARAAGYDWIVYEDEYPENCITWLSINGVLPQQIIQAVYHEGTEDDDEDDDEDDEDEGLTLRNPRDDEAEWDLEAELDAFHERQQRAHDLLDEHLLIAVGSEPNETFMMLHPSTVIPNGWQVSYFDRRGPYGHDEGKDRETAIKNALEMRDLSQVRPVSEEEFMEISTTPEFEHGVQQVAYIGLENRMRTEFGLEASQPYIYDAHDAKTYPEAMQILRVGMRTLAKQAKAGGKGKGKGKK